MKLPKMVKGLPGWDEIFNGLSASLEPLFADNGAAINAQQLGGVPATSYPRAASGMWTPELIAREGQVDTAIPLSLLGGYWYKSGRLVYATANVRCGEIGSNMRGNVIVRGLPFVRSGNVTMITGNGGVEYYHDLALTTGTPTLNINITALDIWTIGMKTPDRSYPAQPVQNLLKTGSGMMLWFLYLADN